MFLKIDNKKSLKIPKAGNTILKSKDRQCNGQQKKDRQDKGQKMIDWLIYCV